MKPGDRTTIINRVALRLSKLSPNVINRKLRKFALFHADIEIVQWKNEYERIVYHLGACEDEAALLEIHRHLFDHAFEETPASWEPRRFRLFFSHVARVKRELGDLRQELSRFAVDGFIAHESIAPTSQWQNEIENALRTCEALAAFLTPDFHQSPWTDQEIGFCLARDILVIPIDMGFTPYGFIGRVQAIKGQDRTVEQLRDSIFQALLRNEVTVGPMRQALLHQFEDSSSFATAKRNIQLLEGLADWTADQLDALEVAGQMNKQISDAFGVPERAQRLVDRHRQTLRTS
jgi:hypothetical protein